MDDRIKQLIEYEILKDKEMNYLEKGIALKLLDLAIAKGDDYCLGLNTFELKKYSTEISDNDEFNDTLDLYMHEKIQNHFEAYTEENEETE